jgi:hypothetical protein
VVIAVFQWALSAYLLGFVGLACFDPAQNTSLLRSAMMVLIGRWDWQQRPYSKVTEMEVTFFFLTAVALTVAIYSAITGWGLFRLRRWARRAVASEYGALLILWARAFFYFGVGGGFGRVPVAKLQPVYIVMMIEATIFMAMMTYGGVEATELFEKGQD